VPAQFTKESRQAVKRIWTPRRFGEASWVLGGQGAAAIGGIIGVPLLAHFLRPEDYGQLALGGTLAALVQQVSLGPLGAAGQRFYASSVEANALAEYLRAAARVVTTSVAIVAVVGVLVISVLENSRWHGSAMLAAWSVVFALLSGISSVFDGLQSAARQRAIVAWHQGLGVWLRFGIAAMLVRWFSGAGVAMLGFAIAMGLTLVSQAVFLRGAILSSPAYRPVLDRAIERDMRRKMWIYARPFSTWGVFTWSQIASDRWALESFSTTRVVGVYQALYQLGYYPISMASAFLNQLVQPILFSRAGIGTDERRNPHTA
jgi:O-antigen/teichoic acid export membrane protein